MITMITKKNTNFPITYGDEPINDGSRLSDKIVHVVQNPRFQRHMLNITGVVLTLGRAAAANAIPPEAGEAAAAAADAAVNLNGQQLPPIGQIEPKINLPAAQPVVQQAQQLQPPVANLKTANLPGPGAQPGPMPAAGFDANPPILRDKGLWLPAKPITTTGQITATSTFILSLTALCLQSGFNPVAAFMCSAGIVGGALYIAKPAAIAGAKFILKMTGAG